MQRHAAKLNCGQTNVGKRRLDARGVAHFAVSILAFLREHLRERSHYIEMQAVNLVVEALRV
jgi:hypothetical protein